MSESVLPDDPARLSALTEQARGSGGDIRSALEFSLARAADFPLPGKGETLSRWRMLAATAAGDLTAARVLEPHLDAQAILAEAGHSAAPGGWGVFAAERAGTSLQARRGPDGWRLDGVKPWCSLGSLLDRALITAHTPAGLGLFEVDLRDSSIAADDAGVWIARGLRDVVSVPLTFSDTPAEPVGEVGWYLSRPGFSWGGVGVAACWLGAADALGSTLTASASVGDPFRDLAIGQVDAALWAAWSVLEAAASAVDTGRAVGRQAELLAMRVRAIVAGAAHDVLAVVGRALGPAPLAFDDEHARRAADLTMYLGQHHGERDLAALGRDLRLAGPGS